MKLIYAWSVGLALALSTAASPGLSQTTTIKSAPLPPEAGTGQMQADPALPSQPLTSPPVPTAPAPTGAPSVGDPAPTAQAGQISPCTNPQGTQQPNGDVTYHKDDLIGAGEGVFGKGAKGLAQIIERILKKQGEPNAYIAGHEAGGAFVVGVRYGSGALCHKVEGQRPVYWTGPSIGFDAGAAGAKVFVLVYNLYDSQELYRRYAEVEGQAFYVGGLSATYLRRGNIVMIPVRLGVGLRLGANVGYMKFRDKNNWVPF